MELFVAGLVLGVLLALCASGRGDARVGRGHQPKVPPADWVMKPPPTTSAVRRPPPRIEPTTGGYGVRPSVPAKPYPPRTTSRA